jgi:hypothetical protein
VDHFEEAGIAEQTCYRRRREYGGIKTARARRLKDLEKENRRLGKAASDLTLDKQILKEALEGNDQVPTDAGAAWNTSKESRGFPSGVSVG